MRVFRIRNWTFFSWEPETIVHGEVAALRVGAHEVELVFTKAADRTFHWEVLDEANANAIATGIETTKAKARRAAETAARRALIRIV